MTATLAAHAIIIAAYGAGLLAAYLRKWPLTIAILFCVALGWMWQASTMQGRPQPLDAPPDEAVILSMVPVPNEAIFLWIAEQGASEPLSIRLPWSMREAQRIGEKLAEQAGKGGAVRYRKPAVPGDEGRFDLDLPPEPAPKSPMQEYGE